MGNVADWVWHSLQQNLSGEGSRDVWTENAHVGRRAWLCLVVFGPPRSPKGN